MRRRLATIIVFSVSPLIWLPTAGSGQTPKASQEKKSPPKQKKAEAASLTGCVDQHEGLYVLIHEQTRSLIANLEADGFPTEGFAKHVGHKVTVRGTSSGGGTDRPVFKVRGVETVSDVCGPQH